MDIQTTGVRQLKKRSSAANKQLLSITSNSILAGRKSEVQQKKFTPNIKGNKEKQII